MKPYYSDDAVTIYHADCRELLPELSADLVLTDPPYPTAHLEYGSIGLSEVAALDIPQVWFWTARAMFPYPYESVAIWDKAKNPDLIELVYSFNWPGMMRLFRYSSITSSVTAQIGQDKLNEHPSQKPIQLMRALLKRCPDGVALDPFMGSGTTLRAAKDLGRKAIGIEIEERYCEIAAKRMAQTVMVL